jgi:hypothetical protein
LGITRLLRLMKLLKRLRQSTKCKKTVWNQFRTFCKNRCYELNASTSDEQLVVILKDWGYNMRKENGLCGTSRQSNFKKNITLSIGEKLIHFPVQNFERPEKPKIPKENSYRPFLRKGNKAQQH